MVLIPKGKKDYCGIGLVEVMWKVVAEVLNLRLTASIAFHDFLHIFWTGHGTGNATLEEKLLQQLAALRKEVQYMIFLDLHKSYDALDRSRYLEILEGYGMVPLNMSAPPDLMKAADNDGKGGRVLHGGF